MGRYFSGTSGVTLPVPNKLLFPPEFQDKSRLTYYGSLFNSVEVNSSFYKLPLVSTVQKWAAGVPEEFKFTFKLWKEITHTKGLAFKHEDIVRFMHTIDAAGVKSGCLLIQFPPSLTVSYAAQLMHLLNAVVQEDIRRKWKLAVEFRNSSWYTDEIFRLADNFNAGIVLQDMPASLNNRLSEHADFVYLRFHGYKGDYKGSYEDEFLSEYAFYIRDWLSEGRDVYVYFNNTRGDAVQNLMTLNRYVEQRAKSKE
ncbi:DUF72 domain-containing protein [Flavihumibacter sp. R14]|nr:DUF72 domain-containing protein [Flavihumibacter soli]